MDEKNLVKWEQIINEKVKPAFIAPWKDRESDENFKNIIASAIDEISALKTDKDENKCYLGEPFCIIGNNEGIKKVKTEVEIPEHPAKMDDVIRNVVPYFNGMYNLAHPKTMFNVVPAAGIPSILGSFLGAMFNPNLVEQDYAGNIAALEIEVAAMISKLIGFDPIRAQGHFTFGGTGAYLFATKLALTKCLGKESRFTGIREDAQILVSEVGHYAAISCTDWTGIGRNNIRSIKLNPDNSMNIESLEETMESCYKDGKPIALIVATIGTTDAFGVDNIKEISMACDRYMARHKDAKRPFIYADAVIGWAWSVFNKYDFSKNPLEFSKEALKAIEISKDKVAHLKYADGVGIDFHKTGFSSYNCTLVLIKDKENLDLLTRESEDMAYLYQFSAYTPGKYTLECSRGGNYPLAAWCNLKYFGLEGYQALLGELVEAEIALRKLIKNEDSMVCINPEDYGFVTLFRIYPESLREKYNVDAFADTQYKNEFENTKYKEDLKKFNDYQFAVAAELRRLTFEDNGPALSYTSEFRANRNGDPVAAIKAFPMTPFRSEKFKDLQSDVINYVLKAARLVDKKNK